MSDDTRWTSWIPMTPLVFDPQGLSIGILTDGADVLYHTHDVEQVKVDLRKAELTFHHKDGSIWHYVGVRSYDWNGGHYEIPRPDRDSPVRPPTFKIEQPTVTEFHGDLFVNGGAAFYGRVHTDRDGRLHIEGAGRLMSGGTQGSRIESLELPSDNDGALDVADSYRQAWLDETNPGWMQEVPYLSRQSENKSIKVRWEVSGFEKATTDAWIAVKNLKLTSDTLSGRLTSDTLSGRLLGGSFGS